MELDCVVRGATLATAEGTTRADIGIAQGRIVALAEDLAATGATVLEAEGLICAPGAIDVHTHFDTTLGGATTADDYESGTRAAAAGGITAILNFAFQEPGRPLREAAERELAKAEGRAHVDYGAHLVVTDPESARLEDLPELAAHGFTSLKVFTAVEGLALNDRDLLRVLEAAARARVMVNVHAEDGALIDHLTARLASADRRSVDHLPEARPAEAEAIAVSRVAAYAKAVGATVYFVHLSSRAALAAVRAARAGGATVWAETRPAYLFLDADRYRLPGREGQKFVCWPPLRSADDQAALWEGLALGDIQTYATDHTTWREAEKTGPDAFWEVPGGVSNVQTSVGMLYAEGVLGGRISASRFVQVTASNPARLFGMWPAKGTLTVGADADLVLIDPEHRFSVTAPAMESRSDFDPYEGYQAPGWPVLTMSRGDVLYAQGRVQSRPGRGRFVRRGRGGAL
jgi:dihydropyrimidinase